MGRPSRTATRRRWSWAAPLAVLALLAAACGNGGETTADGDGDGSQATADGTDLPQDEEFDWRRYEGETIRLVASQHPWRDAIEPYLDEFEDLTGITVEMEALPEEQFRQRLQVELTAGSDAIDVFMSAVMNDALRFHRAGWYEDLKPYIDNPSMTSDEYDYADFGQGVMEGHTFDGELVGIPIQLETQMLFYRRDILEEHGLEVPQTLDELDEVVAEVDDPEGTRGFSSRGRRATAVTQIASFLYNHGADWTDQDGYAAFNTPEGVAAFEQYGRLVREHGPGGASNNSWEELLPMFQQGQLALWVDNSGQGPAVLDEDQSTVSDVVGFAPVPTGDGHDYQTYFNWSIAMSASSQNKEPSWYFLQWATGPEMSERIQADGVPQGRTSVPFTDEYTDDYVAAFQNSLPTARPQLPAVEAVPEVRDVIGEAIVVAIDGGDVQAALDRAAEDFNRIVDRESDANS